MQCKDYNNTIMVTGGAGFIGSHLCKKLLDMHYDVLCVDNLYTGSKDNIRHLLTHPHFEFYRHDVILPLQVEVDAIYHLACPASPVHYQHDPVQTIKTNIHGMINMLDLAKRLHIPILQASTSEVYGDPQQHPQCEDYVGHVNPIGIRACYDEGKRCAETLCFDYLRQYHLNVKVARIFNTYGPHMHPKDGRVVSNFIMQALQQQDITLYGDGQQTRSFCYIDDLVTGLIALMNHHQAHGPINLGNPNSFTILELARKIITKTNSTSNIIYHDLPQDDPKQRCPDITKAKNILNWQPSIMLDEGLDKTIAYFDAIVSQR